VKRDRVPIEKHSREGKKKEASLDLFARARGIDAKKGEKKKEHSEGKNLH